jgi:hypothetical protein
VKFFASLLVTLSSTFALSANAAVIWDESIDGNSASMPSLTLQIGTNEIFGSSRWAGDEIDPFQFTERDWFGLTLQDGLSIKSITTEITNPVLLSSQTLDSLWATAMWTLQDWSYDFKWHGYTRIAETVPFANIGEFPLSGFNNFILNQAAGLSNTGPFDLSWEYRVTIEVVESVQVSEPSSLWLALIALIAIFHSQRSRATKA